MENQPEVKTSKSFKIFLAVFIVAGLSAIGYILVRSGEKIGDITPLLIGAGGGIFLIYWLATEGIGRIYGHKELSAIEKSYLEDISRLKITAIIKKYIFSDLDIQGVIRFVIVMGFLFKWLFFWIFAGGAVLVLLQKDAIFNIAFIVSLAIVWSPWLENLFLKKINYKAVFLGKILLTVALFSITVHVSP